MSESLLSLHRRSGDANLGQTLIRLARLAAEAHRFEVAAGVRAESGDVMECYGPCGEAAGEGSPTDIAAGAAHKEVSP